MSVSLESFANGNHGQRLDVPWANGWLKGQCVSLVQQFLAQCLDLPMYPRGDAKDWVHTIPNEGNGYIVNGTPERGDLLVWTHQGGGYGHIGIATGDGMCFQQNDVAWGHDGTARKIDPNVFGSYTVIRMYAKAPYDTVEPSGDWNWVDYAGFGGTYHLNTAILNVRSEPSTASSPVAQYIKGETSEVVNLDDGYVVNEGIVWGRYYSPSAGATRYIAIGPNTGAADSTKDYLIK